MAREKVRMTAGDIAKKWQGNMKGSQQYILQGVDRVSEAPTAKAAEKITKMRNNLMAAFDEGRVEAGLGKVSLSDWKKATTEKVRARLASGVDFSTPKVEAFDKWLVDTLNGVLPEIKGMPDMTLEDSISRVRRLMEYMHENRYKK